MLGPSKPLDREDLLRAPNALDGLGSESQPVYLLSIFIIVGYVPGRDVGGTTCGNDTPFRPTTATSHSLVPP